MLTQTSELAIRALILIGLERPDRPTSPRQLSSKLRCSPTYLAKTLGTLVRAGILRSSRGARGGVSLARGAGDITLLSIIEGCQGLLPANYCHKIDRGKGPICTFHHVMNQIHGDTVATLSRWTLADLLKNPATPAKDSTAVPCRMQFTGCEAHATSSSPE